MGGFKSRRATNLAMAILCTLRWVICWDCGSAVAGTVCCGQAAEVVRGQIALQGETPKLLCLLGDATDDVTCYQRAWRLSGETSVRAVRSEGLYYYHRKQVGRHSAAAGLTPGPEAVTDD